MNKQRLNREIKEKKEKLENFSDVPRFPIKPTKIIKDKSKYSRKLKHKTLGK